MQRNVFNDPANSLDYMASFVVVSKLFFLKGTNGVYAYGAMTYFR